MPDIDDSNRDFYLVCPAHTYIFWGKSGNCVWDASMVQPPQTSTMNVLKLETLFCLKSFVTRNISRLLGSWNDAVQFSEKYVPEFLIAWGEVEERFESETRAKKYTMAEANKLQMELTLVS